MKLSKSGLAVLGASITLLAVVPAIEAAEAQVRGGGRASVSRGGGGGARASAARPARSPSAGSAQRSRPSAGSQPSRSRSSAAAGSRDRAGGGAAAANRPAAGDRASAGARDRPNAGDRTRPAAGDRPGGGDGNRINTGDRNRIDGGDRTNIRDRETNIDRGDININNDIDIDGDHGWDWDDGWGDHPIAAGVAFGTAAAWTSAVVGSMFYSMPPGCSPYYTSYYYCDGHYYQPQYQGDTVVYVVVDDPAQAGSVTVVQ